MVTLFLFPFKSIINPKNNFSSYIEFIRTGKVKTNISNEFGQRSSTEFIDNRFVSRLTFVETKENDFNSRCFFFIPEEGQTLNLQNSGSYTLLGNSGPECVDGNVSLQVKGYVSNKLHDL